MQFNATETATFLAALRYWQREQADSVGNSQNWIAEDDIATDNGKLQPMSADEIDALCEKINGQAAANDAPAPGDDAATPEPTPGFYFVILNDVDGIDHFHQVKADTIEGAIIAAFDQYMSGDDCLPEDERGFYAANTDVKNIFPGIVGNCAKPFSVSRIADFLPEDEDSDEGEDGE